MPKPALSLLATTLLLCGLLAAPAVAMAGDCPRNDPSFDQVDKNDDHHITKDEFWAAFLDPPHGMAVFRKWDHDKNGTLDREEYDAFLKQRESECK